MGYRIYATKDGQFVQLQRAAVHAAFVTACQLRALGWVVEVTR
jgi:hypothetical protein